MTHILSQARFPAPEFENYTLPPMNLESTIPESIWLKIVLLVVFLAVSGICVYRIRSRRAMTVLAAAGVLVFGFLFSACPCPVGMVQNIAAGAADGGGVGFGILLLFSIPLICALFFGRLYCAGACPLGAIQELLHWKNLHVPAALDQVLRLLPILLLMIFTVLAAAGVDFSLCRIDPYLPLFLLSFSMHAVVLTAVFLGIGLVVSRPFCRYLCPYGVLLRFCALFAWKSPVITKETCIECRLCEQGCPNGAVIAPEPEAAPDVMAHGAKRVARLFAFIPLALCLGGILGCLLAPAAAAQHRDVRLLREIHAGARTQNVEAFEASGIPMSELENRAARVQNFLLAGMCAAGILFAGCVMAELIALARRRGGSEHQYRIDASLCVCCGRCFPACPLNHRKKQKESKP